jgi:hypothetical protein
MEVVVLLAVGTVWLQLVVLLLLEVVYFGEVVERHILLFSAVDDIVVLHIEDLSDIGKGTLQVILVLVGLVEKTECGALLWNNGDLADCQTPESFVVNQS